MLSQRALSLHLVYDLQPPLCDRWFFHWVYGNRDHLGALALMLQTYGACHKCHCIAPLLGFHAWISLYGHISKENPFFQDIYKKPVLTQLDPTVEAQPAFELAVFSFISNKS